MNNQGIAAQNQAKQYKNGGKHTAGKTAETFSGFGKQLLKFIRAKVYLPEDAEDILQEVFYQFERVNAMANPVENAAAWLYRVARNKIVDHYKKKKDEPLPVFYDEDDDEYILGEIADIMYAEETTPETEYLRALIMEEIQTALDDLPKEQREVFVMTELFDFSVKETAEKTHAPVTTVLSRKHYAVKFLRRRLQELYSDVMGK
jgi:RNA polymerase sigma factor (sigma-70 family)